MKDHNELHQLVVSTLEFYENKGINPTAKEVYSDIRSESPRMVHKGFKSFVRVFNSFPEVQPVRKIDDGTYTYKKVK